MRLIIAGLLLTTLSGCITIDNVQPCFSVGVPTSTVHQLGIKINHSDKRIACSGDLSTDLLEPPFPFNDNTHDPNIVELPYGD
jgi:hypothetical protein